MMMEIRENMEIFKDIKGYPNYQVSNFGRVWSKTSQRYLALHPNNRGYLQAHMICINGKAKHELVHRLVALAFIDNPDGKPEVDHIDKDRQNNHVDNLRWLTKSENNKNKNHYTWKKNRVEV